MTDTKDRIVIESIRIDRIRVLNPRVRDKKKYLQIVHSIRKVGLKQPIKVSRATGPDGEVIYDLVYGQGRLEAYVSLGQKEIPAIVTELSEEDSLLLSLVENFARRHRRPEELLHEFGALRKRGYTVAQVARKTGFSAKHVRGVLRLLDAGEKGLLMALETGRMPLKVAMAIAKADDKDAQQLLTTAFESEDLSLRQVIEARRLLERRGRNDRADRQSNGAGGGAAVSTTAAIRLLKKEAARYRREFKKAELVSAQLRFIVEAFRTLLADEHFVTLLRAERVETMPAALARLIEEPADA